MRSGNNPRDIELAQEIIVARDAVRRGRNR
jgi:hypothetical protein